MTANKFIRKLLKLKELVVCGYELNERKRQLLIFVKPYKNGCRCSICDRRCKIKHQLRLYRQWRDLPVYGCSVQLCYRPREILCPTHGRIQENIPWADNYSRITYRFEFAMLIYCQIMTQKAAAQMLHIAQSTLSDLLHRSIERIRDGHRIRNLKAVGVDEISYCKGHKYATIVYDIKKACVVWVGKGKGEKTIDRFFKERFFDFFHEQSFSADLVQGRIQDFVTGRLNCDQFHHKLRIPGLDFSFDPLTLGKRQLTSSCADFKDHCIIYEKCNNAPTIGRAGSLCHGVIGHR